MITQKSELVKVAREKRICVLKKRGGSSSTGPSPRHAPNHFFAGAGELVWRLSYDAVSWTIGVTHDRVQRLRLDL